MGQAKIKEFLSKHKGWHTAREIARKLNKRENGQSNAVSTPLGKLRGTDPEVYSKSSFIEGHWKYIYIHRKHL